MCVCIWAVIFLQKAKSVVPSFPLRYMASHFTDEWLTQKSNLEAFVAVARERGRLVPSLWTPTSGIKFIFSPEVFGLRCRDFLHGPEPGLKWTFLIMKTPDSLAVACVSFFFSDRKAWRR